MKIRKDRKDPIPDGVRFVGSSLKVTYPDEIIITGKAPAHCGIYITNINRTYALGFDRKI